MDKIKYEKPVSLNAGEVASVLGQFCGNGTTPTEGCGVGDDPVVGPMCTPSGNNATFFCGNGGTNSTGNCQNGTVASGLCSTGSTGLTS